MSTRHLRKARTNLHLTATAGEVEVILAPGQWFLEQQSEVVKVFSDPHGASHVGDLAIVDFLNGLAQRHIVFVSWG